VPHQRFAFDLLQFLSFCRWVTGADLKPVGVELSHPGDSSAVFETAFGCLPRFGTRENALLFSSANVTQPHQGSFFRAAQRWFSMTPKEYRLRDELAVE
jgi:hypothetical protein